MASLVRNVREGEIIPPGYGIAWHRPDLHASVALPLGINVIAAWLRLCYQRIQYGINPTQFEQALRKARGDAMAGFWERVDTETRKVHEYYSQSARQVAESCDGQGAKEVVLHIARRIGIDV